MTGMTVSRSFAFEGGSLGGRESGRRKNGKKRGFVAKMGVPESLYVPGRSYPCVWGIPRCTIVLFVVYLGRGTSPCILPRFLLFQPLHLHSPPVRRGSQVVPRLPRREPFAFGGGLLPLFPLFVLRSSFFVALLGSLAAPWLEVCTCKLE